MTWPACLCARQLWPRVVQDRHNKGTNFGFLGGSRTGNIEYVNSMLLNEFQQLVRRPLRNTPAKMEAGFSVQAGQIQCES